MKKFGLPLKVIRSIRDVIGKYPQVDQIILYGSRAKGNFREGSDIDLTLVAPTLSIDDLFKIENEIESLDLPYKVDLSIQEKLDSKDLLEHIKRVGIEFK